MIISGYYPDFNNKAFFKAIIRIENSKIVSIEKTEHCSEQYFLPGFVDAHIHIESSLLLPSEFGKWAVRFGTIACVSDPHEIANVVGKDGVEFMIKNSKQAPIKFIFGAPSCVPATNFETSGSEISSSEIKELLRDQACHFLSEMMNYPGVLNNDKNVIQKLEIAKRYSKPIDGHAPGLSGEELKEYISFGISTDHEVTTLEEAREKIAAGMLIQIRNGSAARDFDSLHPLIPEFPDKLMFCTDDCHPDILANGHIDHFVRMGLKFGHNIFDLLKIASFNPVKHYGIKMGLLQIGDPADFIIVDNLHSLNILETWIDGEKRFPASGSEKDVHIGTVPNKFFVNKLTYAQLKVKSVGSKIRVIVASDGKLITGSEIVDSKTEKNYVIPDLEKDILKIVVVNRYCIADPQIGFIKGFGFRKGAIASSIAHDSHNIIALGTNDEDILNAIENIQKYSGGMTAVNGTNSMTIPLPVAGLMSVESFETIYSQYRALNSFTNDLGTTLKAPFMTLSFMALLVIPELKLSDKGLFDGHKFQFVSLFV